jgi:hypothetical protein
MEGFIVFTHDEILTIDSLIDSLKEIKQTGANSYRLGDDQCIYFYQDDIKGRHGVSDGPSYRIKPSLDVVDEIDEISDEVDFYYSSSNEPDSNEVFNFDDLQTIEDLEKLLEEQEEEEIDENTPHHVSDI